MSELSDAQLAAAPKDILARMYVTLARMLNVFAYRVRVAKALMQKCEREVDLAAVQRLQAKGVIKLVDG